MDWYTLRVISGKEKKIKESILFDINTANLDQYVENILFPTENVLEMRDGKKKIKETPKGRLYGNRYNNSQNFSVWDSMSFIEQIAMILLPCMLCFIFYMMCDIIYTYMIWWLRLIISVGGVAFCIALVTGIVNYFTEY